MDMFLAVAGLILSIGIAIFEWRRALVAEKQFASVIDSLPKAIMSEVHKFWIAGASGEHERELASESKRAFETKYADLDGDGNEELLVEFPVGAYASVLLVYGVKDSSFEKVGELYSSTLGGFEVDDFDHDGRVEIRTDEIARRPALPYAAGLRDEVLHRFANGKFVEVARKELFTEQLMQERRLDFR